SVYDFYIITDSIRYAYCNGQLVNDMVSNGKRTRHWQMAKDIPSYLASVAVADYTEVKQIITTPSHTIPAIIAARAADTNAVKTAFINLPHAVNIYEAKYGLYQWNRVGYCLVPFNSGAMEHATNIAYPQVAIGTTAYEASLMAHELSHHWWGDLVTCETQEDMWINEGMATYSEMIFLENRYNYQQYQNQLLSMLSDMVQFGNFKEQQYWPVSGIPSQYTYGDHVYKKGAIVAHNLRTYLGDSLFFDGLKYVLNQKAYKNMNSSEFQLLLESYTGKNLNKFFQNWVFNGGYPVFVIDSVKYQSVGGGIYSAMVYVKQKLHGAPQYFDSVPVTVSFFNNSWQSFDVKATLSGSMTVFTTTLNFLPQFEILNYDKKLAYAALGDAKVIKNTGNVSFPNSKVSINVMNKGIDSSFLYIEHHFAEADSQKTQTGKKYKISNQHFWKITGKLSNGFYAKLRLNYNGNIVYSGYGCMDTCLASFNADSITVLYRPHSASDWREMKFTKYPSGPKSGMLYVDTLLIGEYTLANKNGIFTSVKEFEVEKMQEIKIYPNPSDNIISIELSTNRNDMYDTKIYSSDMKLIRTLRLKTGEKIHIENLRAGTYFIVLKNEKGQCYFGKFIKN
ncbi:MAG: M1 family aminopeptidase, partial [Bacteroidia bacterium]|nr:M1 family aminopeptidase [Bacteroidia bacterium]